MNKPCKKSAKCGWLACWSLRRRGSGQGWDEGTTGDVLREILYDYPEHVKKALGMALLPGKF